MTSRAQDWKRLEEGPFDLLIIGGGITGCAAARDAAHRGLRVAQVEAVDFAYGTSSRSSKLVHGGLRYLEQYEFSLVFEAVSERRILMNIAPHLVEPLAFLFPVYADGPHRLNVIRTGLWLYDGLALFRSPRMHRTLSREAVAREEPLLRREGLKGVPMYWDCATDDARLTLEMVLDARQRGSVSVNHARVTGFCRDPAGRVCGARVRDELTGREAEVRAEVVVNATGPWTDRTRAMGDAGQRRLLRPTKGIHIVVDAQRLPLRHAVVCNHPDDGRVLFAIPWGDRSYIGTTDTDYDGDPVDVAASAEDVRYLLRAAGWYFPDAALGPDDVLATWAGLRPLIHQDAESASAVSREHEIVVDPDGLVTIAGGKLTTSRRMGAEVVSRAMDMMALLGALPDGVREAQTGREPLPGAVGWPEDDDHDAVARQVLEASGETLTWEQARYLGDRYGTRGIDIAARLGQDASLREPLVPGRPEMLGLVDHAVEEEMACSVSDVLVRRTQVFFRDADQGLGAVERVAARMAERLGWDEERQVEEVLAYRAEVARSRRWREEWNA